MCMYMRFPEVLLRGDGEAPKVCICNRLKEDQHQTLHRQPRQPRQSPAWDCSRWRYHTAREVCIWFVVYLYVVQFGANIWVLTIDMYIGEWFVSLIIIFSLQVWLLPGVTECESGHSLPDLIQHHRRHNRTQTRPHAETCLQALSSLLQLAGNS